MTAGGLQQAAKTLKDNQVDGLVVIGGDGSFKGAIELGRLTGIPIIGCAGTIDNDLVGTDFTIGYDTAINTAIEAIDKIRDTADSHDRVFVVEVMGRDAGLIALRTAIASGAEAVLVPELKDDLNHLVKSIRGWRKNKSSKIVVVAEGDESGGAFKVADVIRKECDGLELRVSILGHIQRGGNPTCMERVNASILGYHAVNALLAGHSGEMIGIINKQVAYTPFEKATKHHKHLRKDLSELIEILSS
jgi:6-phosphofructokinase 1